MEDMDSIISRYKSDLLNFAGRSKFFSNDEAKTDTNIDSDTDENFMINPNEEINDFSSEPIFNEQVGENNTDAEVPTDTDLINNSGTVYNEDFINHPQGNQNDYFGTLKISVFAGNSAFPVEGAEVKVFDQNGNEVYSSFTDLNGLVNGITLPAPSSESTLIPNSPVRGYALYKIIVKHPLYNTAVFENVPIFADMESIQPVRLEVRANGTDTTETVVEI